MPGEWRLPILALIACGYGSVSAMAETCAFSCANVTGPDDYNTTTLNPASPTFINSSTWLTSAINNSSFNNSNWNFSFVDPARMITAADFTNQIYSAWAVTNDAVTGFDNRQYRRPVTNQDAGGANFEVGYSALGDHDPDTTTVSFLQIFQQSINDGATEYFVDNGGSNATPFYVESGGVGGTTTINNNNANWMLDIPFDCENGLTGPLPRTNPCAGGTDEVWFSTDVQFQVFVAVDNFANGVNNVSLYGGEEWGYDYSNFDTPEPALGLLSGLIAAGILLGGHLYRRQAPAFAGHAERGSRTSPVS